MGNSNCCAPRKEDDVMVRNTAQGSKYKNMPEHKGHFYDKLIPKGLFKGKKSNKRQPDQKNFNYVRPGFEDISDKRIPVYQVELDRDDKESRFTEKKRKPKTNGVEKSSVNKPVHGIALGYDPPRTYEIDTKQAQWGDNMVPSNGLEDPMLMQTNQNLFNIRRSLKAIEIVCDKVEDPNGEVSPKLKNKYSRLQILRQNLLDLVERYIKMISTNSLDESLNDDTQKVLSDKTLKSIIEKESPHFAKISKPEVSSFSFTKYLLQSCVFKFKPFVSTDILISDPWSVLRHTSNCKNDITHRLSSEVTWE